MGKERRRGTGHASVGRGGRRMLWRSWLLCVSRGLAVLPSLSPFLLQPLLSLASSHRAFEEGMHLVTHPWKGLGGTWLSSRVDEDLSGSVAPHSVAASRSVCPSLSPSKDVQLLVACHNGDLDRQELGITGWGSWHPQGTAWGSPGTIGAVAGGTLHFLVLCIEEFI